MVRSRLMANQSSATFVMPLPGGRQMGPAGVWITAAGWARAAGHRLGSADIISPQGVMTPDQALQVATTGGRSSGRAPGWRRRVPVPLKLIAKDARTFAEARRFRRFVIRCGISHRPAFVWQNHQLFHTAGLDLARSAGCPSVLFVDAPLVWEAEAWGVRRPGWGRLLERFAEQPQFRQADVVACVSDEVAGALQDRGVEEDRLLVTPCGVDTDLFRPDRDVQAIRARYGLDRRFVIGWAGSFRNFHGLDVLVDALDELRRRIPEIALLLVGDGAERPRIERAVRATGVPVAFPGTVPYTEMPAHLCALDVALLLAPADEPFHYAPLKLREYMACGRAIVAPRVGDVARTLSSGQDGLLVQPGDGRALIAAIEQLARDIPLRRQLGAHARTTVTATGSWSAQLDRLIRKLDELSHHTA